jgi:hypothetical protein
MLIQIIMLLSWFSKYTKMQFHGVSTYLGDSFDYVFIQMSIAFQLKFHYNPNLLLVSIWFTLKSTDCF